MNAPFKPPLVDRERIVAAETLARLASIHAAAVRSSQGRWTALVETTHVRLLAEINHQTGGEFAEAFRDALLSAGVDEEGFALDDERREERLITFDHDSFARREHRKGKAA